MRHTLLLSALLAAVLAAPATAQDAVQGRAATLRVGGRLQAQYATSSVGGASEGFFLRRGRVTIDATLNDFIDGRVQPEFTGGSVGLRDAYLRLRFAPAFQLSMGQFKRSFDLFELESSTDLSIIERDGRVSGVDGCAGIGAVCSYSRFTEKLGFADRDIGLRIAGASGRVDYQVSLTNGTGANKAEENDSKSWSGRVAIEVAKGVVVGAQMGLHDYVSGQDDESDHALAWGADVQVGGYRDGLLLQAAVVGGDHWKNPSETGTTPSFMALQGVASFYAPLTGARLVGIEPLVRLSYGDPDTDLADDGGFVFTPGLMFYVLGRNKLGLNLDVWSPQTGDTEYSLKLQSFLYF